MPILEVKTKDGSRIYSLPEGTPLFIGRAKECDIVLATPAASRRHAVILFKDGVCGVKDLGSFNGTVVNGKLIDKPVHLREEDVLKISSVVMRFSLREAEAGSPSAPPESGLAAAGPGQFKTKAPKANAPEFSSGLRLPRAMSVGDVVDDMIQAIPSNSARRSEAKSDTQLYAAGNVTQRFLKKEMGGEEELREESAPGEDAAGVGERAEEPVASDEDSPAATQYEIPRSLLEKQAASGSADAPSPNETSYFKEAPLIELLRRRQLEESAAAKKIQPPPGENDDILNAEAIIPLLDPETAPVLTLENDPAEDLDLTRTALEKLIEDSSEPVEADLSTPVSPTDDYSLSSDTEAFVAVAADDDFGGFSPEDAGADAADAASGSSSTRFISTESYHPPAGVDAITISPALMTAINTRLCVYSLLFDLSDERKALRMAYPSMPSEVARELERQDAELDSLPTTEEVELNLQKLRERQDGNPESDELRRTVDELANSQWLLIRDSNREALPPIYKEAYKLAADEPLAQDLSVVKLAHGRLLGGSIYLLALQTLAESAEDDRKRISTRIRKLSEEGTEKGKSNILSRFGKLGRLANNIKNRGEIKQETAKLEEEDKVSALRAGLAFRELAFMEKALINEFRQLYLKVAQHFIPKAESMPFSVRAFLRHGAIGFKSWWMSEEVRDFILSDCRNNVITAFERGSDVLNVLYADEYLAAVAQMECSPSPDEHLAALDKSADEWKADRAYRRIVNARTYNVLMEEMLANLDTRIRALDLESQSLENRMQELRARPFMGGKESMFDLQTEHQAVSIRRTNLVKHIKRIEKEVVASIIDSVQEAEGRFRKGELHMPDASVLIAREVESLFDLARRMEGQRRRYLPLVIRDHYSFRNEVLNDRAAVRKCLEENERMDPGIFMNTIISAKKQINRVELRLSPTVILAPALGLSGFCSLPRGSMEGGHLVVPTCFGRENIRKRQLANLLADFRWETARGNAGRDVMNSDTLAGAFMRIRWEWRNLPKVKREKGMIFNELTDQTNWRRVYELYLADAMSGCRQLFQRNQECYFAIIGKYIDLPEGVRMMSRSGNIADLDTVESG